MCLQHPYRAVRPLAARCLGVLCIVSTEDTMKLTTIVMLEKVIVVHQN